MSNNNNLDSQLRTMKTTEYQSLNLPEKRLLLEPSTFNEEALGYAIILSSSFSENTVNLCTRTVTEYYNVSVPNMLFLRGLSLLILGIISSFVFTTPSKVFNVPRHLLPLLFLRGLCGATALALGYKAVSLLPLYIATTLDFLHPFFTMLLSVLFLGEHVTTLELFAALISMFGIALVGSPSFDAISTVQATNLLGVVYSILSAMIVSVSFVSIGALGKRVHFLSLLLSLAIMVTIIGIALGGASLPGLTKGVMIALGGCMVGFLGQCSINLGLQNCRASTGTVIRSIDVPVAYLLGLLFLGEVPQFMSVAGSALVVIGTVIIGFAGMRKTNIKENPDGNCC